MKKVVYAGLIAIGLITFSGCSKGGLGLDVVKETYIHKYGITVSKADWESRGRDGEVITSLRNGIEIRENYSGGKLQGVTTHTFPHSETIDKAESYERGILVKEVLNFPSGLPKQEEAFVNDSERKRTVWFETGTVQSVEVYLDEKLDYGEYYTFSNSIESKVSQGKGLRSIRDAYGLLSTSETIENGELISKMTYHTNGAPKEVLPYRNGVLEGRKKTYHPGGEPNRIETWLTGRQHGLTTIFQNGEKVAELMYVNGRKHGLERRYRDGDNIEEETSWVKDRKHGASYTYVSGIQNADWYHQGEKVSKRVFDKLNEVAR